MNSYFYIINICVIIVFICLFFITRKSNRRWSNINDYLGKVTTTADSVRYGDLTTKIEKVDHPTYQNVTNSINRMVETLNDREKMIVEYQSELMNQNKLLESVINSLSDGILIINDKFEILRATPKILKWFGIKKGRDIIGKNVFDYIQLSCDDSEIDKIFGVEVFIKHSPSNNFIITSQPLSSVEKKRYVMIIKDITTEKEIETLKEDFAATLTHDLKVPIVAASNMIDLLLAKKFGELSDKQEFALSSMRSSNKELLNLVQILLETYKINDAGRIDLVKEKISLNPFIQDIINEMQSIASDSGIEIFFEPSSSIVNIDADSMQLQRVVKNLISNAIDHSGSKKGIEIKVSQDQNFALISVVDFGQGIPKQNIKLIFNKYFSASNKMRKVGTGLGLYLSQKIVQAHGGEISVTSKQNVRTEFLIKLPK